MSGSDSNAKRNVGRKLFLYLGAIWLIPVATVVLEETIPSWHLRSTVTVCNDSDEPLNNINLSVGVPEARIATLQPHAERKVIPPINRLNKTIISFEDARSVKHESQHDTIVDAFTPIDVVIKIDRTFKVTWWMRYKWFVRWIWREDTKGVDAKTLRKMRDDLIEVNP
jgi:hypothetical protein